MLVKPLVRHHAIPSLPLRATESNSAIGRVAAGAIAEKYLKLAYGIEIVAFVSSVGKVHLPSTVAPPSLVPSDGDEDNDEAQDALSEDFRKLIATITREEVDKFPTRCPHHETSERMIKVSLTANRGLFRLVKSIFTSSESFVQRTHKIRLEEP